MTHKVLATDKDAAVKSLQVKDNGHAFGTVHSGKKTFTVTLRDQDPKSAQMDLAGFKWHFERSSRPPRTLLG